MLKRTIATGACLLAAMLFAAGAQVSAKPLAGSAFSDIPLTQAPADARIVQVDDFGFGFRFGDHGWRGRHWDRHGYGYGWRHRRYGPSFSLAIPVVPRTYAETYADAGSCPYWSQRCADSWGYDNSDYRGCMRYYGC
jgi:hypothetical protein